MDEQLLPTKARCRFTQYMPYKPEKFGIKFWIAIDVKTKYMLNSFTYIGKDDSRSGVTLGEHIILRLLEPYRKTGRNLTTDSFFTSVNLAKTLRQQGISIVGTVNRIQKEIRQEIKKIKKDLYTTKVFKHDGCTLTVFKHDGGTIKKFLLLLIQVTTKNLSLKP